MRIATVTIVGLALGLLVSTTASLVDAQDKKEPPRPKNAVLDFNIFSLRGKEPKDPVSGRPSKAFMVKLLEGNTYAIDLRSMTPKFDPLVRLEDEAGKEVGKDDNSGGGVDAHLVYKPAKTGNFKVIVTAASDELGRFHLIVDQHGNVGTVGTGTEVVLMGGAATLSSKLLVNDPRDTVKNESPARSFPIKMSAGKTYVIDMIGKGKTGVDFDPYLRLEDSAGKEVAANDDGGGNFNARITYACTKSGSFTIIATTVHKGAGFFDLKVAEK
jgi:hypothetical protein